MMNGYAMSGWGWLLMTLGILGFWALVAVLALALLRHPGPQPAAAARPAAHGPAPRRFWPSGWPAASSTPRSTASASRPPGDHQPADTPAEVMNLLSSTHRCGT